MRKLRIFYYNNKEKIWKIIGLVVLIFTFIQIINYYVGKENSKKILDNNENNTNTQDLYMPSKAIISDTKVSAETTKSNTELIDKFIKLCNEHCVEEAYNLLSNDCKKELFPTVNSFYNNYYKDIFTEKKSYSLEAWMNNGSVTYKVKIIRDIMSLGMVEEEYIEDYYTVVKDENKEKKLNIKNFIGKEKIEKESSINEISFSVLENNIYMDYTEFIIKVTNNSAKKVVIDSKENTKSVYLVDKNGVSYSWYGHEIDSNELRLESGQSVQLKIKFNKMYNTNRTDKNICFTDILQEGKKEKEKIEINL